MSRGHALTQMDVAHALKGHSSGLLMGSFWSERRRFTLIEMFSFFSLYGRLALRASEKQHGAPSLIRRTLFACKQRKVRPRGMHRRQVCFQKVAQRAIVIFWFLTLIHPLLFWDFFFLFFWETIALTKPLVSQQGISLQNTVIHSSHISSYMWFCPPSAKSQASAISQ